MKIYKTHRTLQVLGDNYPFSHSVSDIGHETSRGLKCKLEGKSKSGHWGQGSRRLLRFDGTLFQHSPSFYELIWFYGGDTSGKRSNKTNRICSKTKGVS